MVTLRLQVGCVQFRQIGYVKTPVGSQEVKWNERTD